MISLDLDELDSLDQSLRFFSRNRGNLYEFRDRDHLEFPAPGVGDLKASLTAWLASEQVQLPPDARFQLVTLPRVAGYIFNPVSFIFVHSADGKPICAITEVGNTFGELKPFFIPAEPDSAPPSSSSRFCRVVPKQFYVSPFSDLEVNFSFNLRAPGERLEIGINDVTSEGQTLLISTLVGSRRPLTDGHLLRLTARYPLMTLRVITLIHWQAFKLWWKRLPWHPKADQPQLQQGVFRPHSSLSSLPNSPRVKATQTDPATPTVT